MIAQTTQILKGNEPLLLNEPNMVWRLKSGSVVVFSTLAENGELKGSRRYLFSVGVGEGLFGAGEFPVPSLGGKQIMMAVALEETEIEQLPLTQLIDFVQQGHKEAICLVENWLTHLGKWSSQQPLPTEPVNPLFAEAGHFISLLKGQGIGCAGGNLLWVDVRKGSARWMGFEDLIVTAKGESTTPDTSNLPPLSPPNPPLRGAGGMGAGGMGARGDSSFPLSTWAPIPLVAQMWLEAQSQLEVYTASTSELDGELFLRGLNAFHTYFLYLCHWQSRQELESEFRRFRERERLNRQMVENSMGELTSVLAPTVRDFFQEGSSLLIAAGAVARAADITIKPPATSEDQRRLKDPLEAIASSSQFRTRRVILAGRWWQQEHGPLLAYTKSNEPVALLLDEKKRYVLFDPAGKMPAPAGKMPAPQRTLVNEEVAATLNGEAYSFYRPLPPRVKNVLEIFSFALKGYESDLIAVVVLGLLGTLLGMVTPQATAILVNNAIPDSDRVLLFQIGLALFAAAFGQSAFQLAQQIITLRVENAADGALQTAVWDRLLKLTPGFFRGYSSGDLLNRLMAVSQIRAQLSGATQKTLLSGVFALLNLVLMFVYSVKLAFVGVALTLLVMIVTSYSSRLLVSRQRIQQEIDGEINSLTVELINGVAKLRVAAAEERAFATWGKKYSQRERLQSAIKRIDDSVSVFNEALPLVSSVLMYWFAIFFIQLGEAQGNPSSLSAGTFLAFNAAFAIFLRGGIDISNTLTDILEVVPLWERALPILRSPLESDPTKADPGKLTGRISLDHVTFRYRQDGPLILDDVSIHAEPGEFVAIVGPSGSGKSTVFRLLLGFETPLSGTVYYDGQDLAGLDIQALRRQLGVVLQNVRISSAPLFDSIACGALIKLEEAWEAARMAGFEEDIKAMPMGMHTVISEGGTNLSGGQRQRLLIARALVLKPKVILMDEATSALDNQTQAIVTESLDKLNATRVVIAHRLSTIRNADRIYVIESGRVVQVGTFDELVNQEGLFARLVARQLD